MIKKRRKGDDRDSMTQKSKAWGAIKSTCPYKKDYSQLKCCVKRNWDSFDKSLQGMVVEIVESIGAKEAVKQPWSSGQHDARSHSYDGQHKHHKNKKKSDFKFLATVIGGVMILLTIACMIRRRRRRR